MLDSLRIRVKEQGMLLVDFLLSIAQRLTDGLVAIMPRKAPLGVTLEKSHIIAHRGAHDNKRVIENTLNAFQLAEQTGCWGIELDVHATQDRVLIVNHDPTLTRLWGHKVAIRQLSFNQLRTLEPNVPTLAEVVQNFGKKMHFFIELKTPFDAWDSLTQTLEELTPCQDFHLISLDAKVFNKVLAFPKSSLLLVAEATNLNHYKELSLKEHYGGVLGHYAVFSPKKIDEMKANNQVVGVGFVNSKQSLYRELSRGLEYLFTNNAQKVCQHLRQLVQKNP